MKGMFFLFLFHCSVLFSQPLSFEENNTAHRKYWYYRTRFVNDFTKIGGDQGDCICFAERNYYDQFSATAKVGPDQIDIMNQYLCALAIEYRLLQRANQSTNETLKEIYYILKMYNRIDAFAEYFWLPLAQNGMPPNDDLSTKSQSLNLNGFMLREDMPAKYFNKDSFNANYRHFNYAFSEYNNNDTSFVSFTGMYKVESLTNDNHFSNSNVFNGNIALTNMPLVHDKYYSMFVAFLYLIKYIPDNTVYSENGQAQIFQDNVYDIKTEVRNITNRCHLYLRDNVFSNVSDWIMRYPDGTVLDPLNLGTPFPFFTYPLVNTICNINKNYSNWTYPCLGMGDLISLNTGNHYMLISSTNAITQDNSVFLANNHVASSTYPTMPVWIKMMQNTSLWNVKWADLSRKVLHQNGMLTRQKSVYSSVINTAPCQGPYNFGPNNLAPSPWNSQDYLEHPNMVGGFGPPANYPGVDYMLLHNLYYEYLNQLDDQQPGSESGRYKNAYNLMDNYDEGIYPLQINIPAPPGNNMAINMLFGVDANVNQITNPPGQGLLQTVQQPGRIKLFQNLQSRAQIYATSSPAAPNNTISSKIEYRAGKDITLLPENGNQPGFEVKAGSDFWAHIQRYVCTGDNDPLNLRQNTNNPYYTSNDFETDEMNMDVPLHYVNHPLSEADLYPFGNAMEGSSPSLQEEIQKELLAQYQQAQAKDDTEQLLRLERSASTQRFIILPNPNDGHFKLYANAIADDEQFNVSIYNMSGALEYEEQKMMGNVSREFDFTNKPKGVYLVQLVSSKGYRHTSKIQVN